MTSGFGKVILLGEHAVVHGHPALAGAIDRAVRLEARPARDATTLSIPDWSLAVSANDDHPVAGALAAILDRLGLRGRAFEVRGESDLPPAAGLGSSAALAVALARSLSAAAGRALAATEVEEVAEVAERRFHRTPSGIDVALAARGGLGLYTRAAGLAPVAAAPLALVVGLSGESRQTGEMVAQVASRLERAPGETGELLARLGDAARAGAEALGRSDSALLGALLNEAHEILSQLELSTAALDRLVATARAAGALGAKLTGAGGGGAVIALAPGREEEVERAWSAAGFGGLRCLVGGAG